MAVGDYFRLVGNLAVTDTVDLEWHVAAAEEVMLSYRFGADVWQAGGVWERAAEGKETINLDVFGRGYPGEFRLYTDARLVGTISWDRLPCMTEWAIDDIAPACPETTTTSLAVYQRFEGGFMLWIEALDKVYTSDWNGNAHHAFDDTYVAGRDRIEDRHITPAPGRYQPTHGLGKVWRENRVVRDYLGWATEREINYTAVWQNGRGTRSSAPILVTLPNGGYFTAPYGYVSPLSVVDSGQPTPTPIPVATVDPETHIILEATQLDDDDYFRLEGDLSVTDSVWVTWRIGSADSVTLHYSVGEHSYYYETYEQSGGATGRQPFNLKAILRSTSGTISLEANDGTAAQLHWEQLLCRIDWAVPVAAPCPAETLTSRANVQRFEGGVALWIEARNSIYTIAWDGIQHDLFIDSYVDGVDPVNDPSLTPPSGRYQPEYGIGKVWRENEFVRDYLGWATDWGTDYTAVWQDGYEWGHTVPLLITLPDDGYIRGDIGYLAPLTIYNYEPNP